MVASSRAAGASATAPVRSTGTRSKSSGCWAAAGQGSSSPRCFVTRKLGPSSALAAVAPSTTTISGRSRANSATSQGRQAVTCTRSGVWWMRRLPRSSNRKCFTAFVR